MLKSGCSNEPSFLGVNAGRLKLSWKVCAVSEEEVVKEEEERGRWGSCTCKDIHNKRHKQQVLPHHLLSTCVFWLTSNLGFSPQQLGKMRMMLMEAISEKRLCAARGQLSAC